MKQSTREYFEGKRWAYNYMIDQECVPTKEKGMPGEIYNLIREEFDPGYENDTQCPPCAFAIIKEGFRLFDQAVKQEQEAKPLIVAATFPKQEPMPSLPIPGVTTIVKQSEVSPEEWAHIVKMAEMQKKMETQMETKARLADPNRIIKRRAKRKK